MRRPSLMNGPARVCLLMAIASLGSLAYSCTQNDTGEVGDALAGGAPGTGGTGISRPGETGGTSQAGPTENGGLRSYASMTYSGLKSMIYAGLDKNDPRAKAAYDWARKHYTLAENPGMGQQGLFYYYQTFAKALDAMEVDQVEDAGGQSHDWRSDLAAELLNRQKPNGSWVNSADRWYEGDPNLVTAYTLMALARVSPAK